ncbi:MAG: hypothetical protein KKC80_05895 [Candidatus Margulisbacteria bacterium]|nr:hypothetical protein [Candidatus Margulisiibacteriota bacterium]MBU1616396.1 hypothetical protein [Candidatus Margulisiibacteriota bacterium]
MAVKEKTLNLNFSYVRKRIKKEKILPAICSGYVPVSYSNSCAKAKVCKNATYGGDDGKESGVCYGGTTEEERVDRERYIIRKLGEKK